MSDRICGPLSIPSEAQAAHESRLVTGDKDARIAELTEVLKQCRADYCVSQAEATGVLNACRTVEDRYAAQIRLDAIKARLGNIATALAAVGDKHD